MSGFKRAAVLAALGLVVGLSACGRKPASGPEAGKALAGPQGAAVAINDADLAKLATPAGGAYDPAMVKLQVLLDRARFSPGVIDGRAGDNVRRAIAAFEKANGMAGDGTPTKAVWDRLTMADPRPAVRGYAIDADTVAGPFTPDIPKDFPGQAKLDHLGYRSPAEELAASFHMDVGLLTALNPKADFRPGSKVLVADRGGDDLDADIDTVEVDRAAGVVRVSGPGGKLMAVYPASIGSRSCAPIAGVLTVRSIAAQPTYSYDSDSLGVLGAVRGRTEVAPGPNNPLGVVWVDLSRDGYGIHGSADPGDVGKPQGHGCVRLTNWDARELARGVKPGVKVVFK